MRRPSRSSTTRALNASSLPIWQRRHGHDEGLDFRKEHQRMNIIERASPADLAAILALLERCGLPQAGMKEAFATTVVVGEVGRAVGGTGLKVDGKTAVPGNDGSKAL